MVAFVAALGLFISNRPGNQINRELVSNPVVDNAGSKNSPVAVMVGSPYASVSYNFGSEDSLLREYANIALLYPEGSDIRVGEGLSISGGLYLILKDTHEVKDGKLHFNCDENSQNVYKHVMEIEPKFPFSYFALADCRKANHQGDWESYARKAVEIFQITTRIGGHRPEHDEALKILLGYLEEIKE